MLESVEDGAKNRLATVFFYLNNVSSGGETNFPRAASERWPDGAPTPRDYFDCSQGLSVYPAEGKVIIFYSMLPSGEMDELSLHGGCDVLKETETKYSANFWCRRRPPDRHSRRIPARPPTARHAQAVEQAVPLPLAGAQALHRRDPPELALVRERLGVCDAISLHSARCLESLRRSPAAGARYFRYDGSAHTSGGRPRPFRG